MPKPVAKLKADGQALILKGDFNAALKKFTLALGQTETDSQLLVGRATCLNSLRRYSKAMNDATKATQLDRNCHEGWIQLASSYEGVGDRSEAMSVLENGLDILSRAPVSKDKEKLTQEYETKIGNLKDAVNVAMSALPDRLRFITVKEGECRLSWDRANALIPSLLEEGNRRSSAHVISEARKMFESANDDMEKLEMTKMPTGTAYNGTTGAVQSFAYSMLKDTRAFSMDRTWMEKYLSQVQFEVGALMVPEPEGPMFVLEQITAPVRELLKKGGWDAVRPAIVAAVSISIMHGLHTANIMGDVEKCVQYLDGAIEIIRWGQQEWPDVPHRERGVVFDDMYLRALRSLRLEKYIDAWMTTEDDSARFTLEGILEEAGDILDEFADPSTPVVEYANQPGFSSSFFYYPEANCHACKGFYHLHKGYKLRQGGDKGKAKDQFDKAAQFYQTAARRYPPDEEKSIQFFDMALTAMFEGEQPLRQMLPIIFQILKTDKERTVKKIWEFSPLYQRLEPTIELLKTFNVNVEKKLRSGSISLDSCISPRGAVCD
ncbi:hypothetical protein OF83DRAFT_1106058 [Amylostereum chailletii]|nr:hypothetical protein OF83DRAFT_1106058 [Amylostereum chailletii]